MRRGRRWWGLLVGGVLLVGGCAAPLGERPYKVAPWSGALVGADGRTLTVLAPSGGCAGEITPSVVESDRAVAVVLTDRPFNLHGSVSCMSNQPVVQTVRLARPLGRRVVEDFASRRLAVLTAGRLRTPRYLPAGYQQLQDVPAAYPPGGIVNRQPTTGRLVWSRIYGVPSGTQAGEPPLTGPLVISQAPHPIPTGGWQRVGPVTVAGHPATLYTGSTPSWPGGPPSQALAWSAGGWSVVVSVNPRHQPSSTTTAQPTEPTAADLTAELERVAGGLA